MSHFEYISVAASLIYSLILARLLGALPSALRAGARYWVHILWIVSLLFVTLGSWWQIWSYREVAWTPIRFVVLMTIPSIIYLRAAVLLGDGRREIASWREHYYAQRRPFFLLQLLNSANLVASRWLIAGETLPMGTHIGIAWFSLLAMLAVLSASPRLHEIVAVMSLAAFASGLFVQPW